MQTNKVQLKKITKAQIKPKKINTKLNEKDKTRTMRAFSTATFLNDAGAEMINSIWPMFLTSFFGLNMTLLGLIDGLGDAIVSISQAISGYYSDRLKKRKVFIWTGYLFGAASRIGYAISSSWLMIIPFRILDRAGKIRGAPRDAMVADLSEHKERGKNFGILRLMDNAGALVGIILAIIFLNFLGISLQTMFLIAAIPSIIGAVALIYFIKERKLPTLKLFKGLQLKNLDKNFYLFLSLSTIFALATFSYSFLLMFAKNAGWPVIVVPALYFAYNLVAAVFSYPFGKLSDIIGRKNVMYLALAFWIITCIISIITNVWWAIILIFILYGLHRGALDPVQKTFVAELAPEKFRASALGGFQMSIGLAALPASIIAGALWDNISPQAPFVLSLILTIIAIVILMFVKESGKDKK
ncbi:MAG: MFS transporter [archaeon]